MSDRHTREALSCFESHDYVGRWYRDRHSRELSAERIREITSCFSQGREYFASGAGAGTSVRPLLLYYGIVALSRGLIMLRDPFRSEASLKPSHGLEAIDWRGTLSKGIANIFDLQVRATEGTFTELAAAVGNTQQAAYWTMPDLTPVYYQAQFAAPRFTRDRSPLSLDDLLGRDHRLVGLYDRTTKRPTRIHLGEVIRKASGVEVYVFGSNFDAASILKRFGFPAGTPVHLGNSRRARISSWCAELKGYEGFHELLPTTVYVANDGMFVVEDFPNGDRLSILLRTFLLSYCLGMLVRYFPSRWMSLLRNEKGDVAQPLLLATVSAIEGEYPALVVQALA